MEEKLKQNTEDINKLKDKCASYDTCMALMQKDIQEIKSDIGEIKESLKIYLEQKADKWVEKFAIGLILISPCPPSIISSPTLVCRLPNFLKVLS